MVKLQPDDTEPLTNRHDEAGQSEEEDGWIKFLNWCQYIGSVLITIGIVMTMKG